MTDTTIAVPGATTTVTEPGTQTTTTTQAAPWYTGASEEEVGYLQNRGWDKLDAKTAALAAGKAHREAEKLIGAPAASIVRLPKDSNDTAAIADLYAKLGVPADGKYDFTGVKFADGTELGEDFTAAVSKALHSAGVAKDKAPEIVRAIVALGDAEEATSAAGKTAALETERAALRINWGSNVEANLAIARNAAAQFGPKIQEAVNALEGQIGYAAVMEMFRTIGTSIQEPAFHAPGIGGGGQQVTSVAQARATLAQNMADAAWGEKLSNGDATALREFDNLTRLISAADAAAARQ